MIIACALGICVVCTLFTQFLLRRSKVPPLVAGKLPVAPVLGTSFIIRAGACVAVAAMSVGMLNHSSEWLKQREEEGVWQNLPAAYAVSLSGARALEDIHEASSTLAAELRAISAEHRLIYAQFLDPGQLNFATFGRDVLVYNQSAAEISLSGTLRNALEGSLQHGSSTSPAAQKGEITWLIPDSLSSFDKASVERVFSPVQSDVKSAEIRYRDAESSRPAAVTWEVSAGAWMNRSQSVAPIVAVIPDDLKLISDRNLVAAVTQLDALLLDYDDYENLQNSPVIGSFLQAPIPMSQTWSESHHAMGRTVWVYGGGFIAALVLAAISAYSSLRTYLRLFRQRLRVSFIHGTLPLKLVIGYAALEALALGTVAFYLYHRGAPVRQWSEGGQFAGSADPSLIAMFSVPTSAWVISLAVVIATSLPVFAILFRRGSVTELIQSSR